MLVGHRDRGVAGERRLAGEQLEQHAAGGVDVAAGVDGLAARLLGRQVLRGADHRGGLGDVLPLAQRAGDAEVHHLHRAGAVDHDVRRLHVAMDDVVLVAEVQRGADVGHHLDDPLLAHRPLRLDDLAQRVAVDVLHHDVGQRPEVALHLAGVVDRDDRGVVERGGVLGLAAEPQLELRVPGEVGAQHLHGHVPAEALVHPAVHLGHAAVAERVAQLVAVGEQTRGGHRCRFLTVSGGADAKLPANRTTATADAAAAPVMIAQTTPQQEHPERHRGQREQHEQHQEQPTPRPAGRRDAQRLGGRVVGRDRSRGRRVRAVRARAAGAVRRRCHGDGPGRDRLGRARLLVRRGIGRAGRGHARRGDRRHARGRHRDRPGRALGRGARRVHRLTGLVDRHGARDRTPLQRDARDRQRVAAPDGRDRRPRARRPCRSGGPGP